MPERFIRISSELLNSFLRENELWKSSLPDDVRVLAIVNDEFHSRPLPAFMLLVKSNEFSAVPEGHRIPFLEPVFVRKKSVR